MSKKPLILRSLEDYDPKLLCFTDKGLKYNGSAVLVQVPSDIKHKMSILEIEDHPSPLCHMIYFDRPIHADPLYNTLMQDIQRMYPRLVGDHIRAMVYDKGCWYTQVFKRSEGSYRIEAASTSELLPGVKLRAVITFRVDRTNNIIPALWQILIDGN